jgi:hypothetical protein
MAGRQLRIRRRNLRRRLSAGAVAAAVLVTSGVDLFPATVSAKTLPIADEPVEWLDVPPGATDPDFLDGPLLPADTFLDPAVATGPASPVCEATVPDHAAGACGARLSFGRAR